MSAHVCMNPDCGREVFPRVDPAIIVLVCAWRSLPARPAEPAGRRAATRRSPASSNPAKASKMRSAGRFTRKPIFGSATFATTAHNHGRSQSSLMLGFHRRSRDDPKTLFLNDGELEDAQLVYAQGTPLRISKAAVPYLDRPAPGRPLDRASTETEMCLLVIAIKQVTRSCRSSLPATVTSSMCGRHRMRTGGRTGTEMLGGRDLQAGAERGWRSTIAALASPRSRTTAMRMHERRPLLSRGHLITAYLGGDGHTATGCQLDIDGERYAGFNLVVADARFHGVPVQPWCPVCANCGPDSTG